MNTPDAVDRLLGRMTLDEKIGQLNLLAAGEGIATGIAGDNTLTRRLDTGRIGAIFGTKSLASARSMQERALAGSRLKIPLFFAEDVIHGHRTVFPLPIALACSWNMALIEETAAFAAAEAAAEGLHQVYAPMIDIARDPRWGRVAESPGEDPYLASRVAVAMTRGFQGAQISAPGRVAACLKHFVAYGATASGRDYDNASLAWEDLLGTYLPPFAAGVRAGAASVMAAFNAVNKLPMHCNEPLIEGWLRSRTGFEGLVVSDYTGVRELIDHGMGPAPVAVARALHAGIDMDMVGEDYLAELPALAARGIDAPDCAVSFSAGEIVALIDRACRRVLRFKADLGLLDDPFRGLTGRPAAPSPAAGRKLARKAAAAAAVLLKNNGVLPLRRNAQVALIGPLGADRANLLGTWSVSGRAEDVVPLDQAIAALTGHMPATAFGSNIVEEQWLVARTNVHGVTVEPDERPEAEMLAEAVALARASEVVIVAVGEAKEQAGESSSRLSPDLPAPQRRLVAALAETGTPLVIVVFAGRPLAMGHIPNQADALMFAWHNGIAGPEGVADLLFGVDEPSGRLAATLPAAPGEVPLSYAEEPTGRPFPGHFAKFRTGWLDLADDLQRFPFGFGLGYAPVRYGPPRLSATKARLGESVRLTVEITNEGDRPAVETPQLYLSDPVARTTRPGRFLVDFQQVSLAPGETRAIEFVIDAEMARYPVAPSLETAEWVWDPGLVRVHVGPNSRDTQMLELTWQA
ncbi:glycoside hydrolase family 3 N-terminal domain-containing protein [Tropicimonas sp. IMCC34043]|uniref:glycoside hydrolase family 3 N-terminal domain-containing protein n=1 Tax=Tropicimonas sp. IMCC34043 TaxID=2248760 RepID=UPI0018E4F11A|nr:glycoside hydrolase family 3 N-terminal domain-containing protein [Tropicimonas sp. IMCC34043]